MERKAVKIYTAPDNLQAEMIRRYWEKMGFRATSGIWALRGL